jgi:hypothetical protein
MTSSLDTALAQENDAIARKVGAALRVDRPMSPASSKANQALPATLSDLVTRLEIVIEKYPRETVVVAAFLAFGAGTLWRRGYL